ncbi:gliding motility-associated C-terminal domain-containing protein [Parapedobacter pyrenivorans]|nr:gliding motility-associated C-terminal domain-containing protein [Parapedobacter pyrenivorans]
MKHISSRLSRMKAVASLWFSLLLAFCANAETFVVTSNASSGPGTLRNALERAAANGSDETDYIHFNLPGSSLAARTITLTSSLPDFTPHIVLDATTQPGNPFGTSQAKIRITPDRNTYLATGLGVFAIDSIEHITIYGFIFEGFHSLMSSPPGSYVSTPTISVTSSSHVIIGAPGKGNVFWDNPNDIDVRTTYDEETLIVDTCNFITVQANYIGCDTNANFTNLNAPPEGLRLNAKNLVFGGEEPAEGNLIAADTYVQAYDFFMASNVFLKAFSVVVFASKDGVIRDNDFGNSPLGIQHHYGGIEVYGNKGIAGMFMISYEPRDEGVIKIGSDREEDINIFTGSIGSDAEVRKNSFRCVDYAYYVANDTSPVIAVTENSNTTFRGTATPGADIYIYEDDSDCEICSPVTFFRRITADASGSWSISGDFSDKRLLANAVLGNASSPYTQVGFSNFVDQLFENFQLVHPDCNDNNGSITLLNLINVLHIDWYDADGNKVGEGVTASGLSAGSYTAVLRNGNCSKVMHYDLHEPIVDFIDYNMVLHHPTCGVNNGAVVDLDFYSIYNEIIRKEWRDAAGHVVDTTGYLENVAPGTYTMYVYISETCFETYEVTLERMDGPTVDLSAMVATPISCAGPGRISGIRVNTAAVIEYHWLDASGARVGGDGANLSNITHPGTYRLALVGDAACDTIWAASVHVPEEGVLRMDETAVRVTPVGCDGDTQGSIHGIQTTNATNYQWVDGANRTVGNTLVLKDMSVGRYRLRASNTDGCEVYSAWYEVAQLDPVDFPAYTVTKDAPHCEHNNGRLAVEYGSSAIRPTAQRWADQLGNDLGHGQQITELAPGTYHLYLTDHNGCETLYQSITLLAIPLLEVDITAVNVLHVTCASPNGQISNVQVHGGVAPYRFTWYDHLGVVVSESEVLQGVAAGHYSVSVKDAEGCSAMSGAIEISTSSGDDLTILNAFSPNGDGINDTWLPSGVTRYTRASVTVFDRNGQQVYRMTDAQQPFDGRYRGADLPVGPYYFIIDLGNACPPIKGSLNLLR